MTPKATRRQYIDALDRMLRTQLDDIVAQYLPKALEHGNSETQLRAWLTGEDIPGDDLGDGYVGYQQVADMNGVQKSTLARWLWNSGRADKAGIPHTPSCYIRPDNSEGKVREWWAPRVILYGWRSGRIIPGTLTPMKRLPPGAPRNQQRVKKQ